MSINNESEVGRRTKEETKVTKVWKFNVIDPENTIGFEVNNLGQFNLKSGKLESIFKTSRSIKELLDNIDVVIRLMNINSISGLEVKEEDVAPLVVEKKKKEE